MPHTGVAAHDATVLWTQVATLLLLAWALGGLARRVGQPPIVGSLLAGLLAGPSVFGHVWPSGFHWFRPGTQLHAGLLGAVAEFSLLILLIVLGAETDLALIRRLGRPAATVTAGSLVVPLLAGAGVAVLLPASMLGTSAHRSSFVLLIAAAMAVSSLPVIARIASEMNITRRNVGQLSIAAATVNDGVGFVLLAVAAALTGGSGSTLVVAAVGLVGLVFVLPALGRHVLDAGLRRSRHAGPNVPAGVGLCVVFTLVVAAAAQAAGVDAALGAFVAGIVIGRSRYLASGVLSSLGAISDAVFAPLYFATAGVAADVTLLGGTTAIWVLVMFVVAVASKFVAVYVSARLARLPRRDAAALGISLNGRGALQVILATAGLTAGILGPQAFTAVIVLAIASSVSVPPLLRRTLQNWAGTTAEQERLAHEDEMATNVIVRGQRLLVPTRGSTNSAAAARIVDLAWPASTEVTLLRLPGADEEGLETVRATLFDRDVREESADNEDTAEAIIAHANLGYGAIAVGATDEPGRKPLPPVIEQLLNHSPIPIVIVRRGDGVRVDDHRPVIRPRRILAAVTGNAASRAGQEVAEAIAQSTGADLSLLHVVTRPDPSPTAATGTGRHTAQALLTHARRRAADKNLVADVVARDAAFSGPEIEREAQETASDLIVLGTTVRRVDDQPFLGHTVAHLLEHACTPTVVVVALPDAQQAAAEQHIDRRTG